MYKLYSFFLYRASFFLLILFPIQTNDTKEIIIKEEYNTSITYIITTIKETEGIEYIPYTCPAGYLTIGAGHMILPTDKLKIPLSDKDIDSIIIKDLYDRYKGIRYNISIKRKLILSWLYYIYGNNILGTQLEYNIIHKLPIKHILKDYSHYISNKQLIYSDYLYNILIKINILYEKT